MYASWRFFKLTISPHTYFYKLSAKHQKKGEVDAGKVVDEAVTRGKKFQNEGMGLGGNRARRGADESDAPSIPKNGAITCGKGMSGRQSVDGEERDMKKLMQSEKVRADAAGESVA